MHLCGSMKRCDKHTFCIEKSKTETVFGSNSILCHLALSLFLHDCTVHLYVRREQNKTHSKRHCVHECVCVCESVNRFRQHENGQIFGVSVVNVYFLWNWEIDSTIETINFQKVHSIFRNSNRRKPHGDNVDRVNYSQEKKNYCAEISISVDCVRACM